MDTQHIRNACVIYLLMFICVSVAALAAPATLTQSVTYNSETITMRLTKENLRGEHFELWQQNSSGGYDVITPVEERSYIGTVDEYPDAVSCGILKDNGVFWGAVYFDRGVSWFTLGSDVIRVRAIGYEPENFDSFIWTYWDLPYPGQSGSTMYGFDVGIDVRYDYYAAAGSNTATAFEQIEHSVSMVRPVYMSNALLQMYLSRVIIRGDEAQDPYEGVFLADLAWHWVDNHSDADYDTVAGVSPSVGGGVAYGTAIGKGSGFSVSGSVYGEGSFEPVWRHELGHNWSATDYNGGSHEGETIMCGNNMARFNASSLWWILNYRDDRYGYGIIDNLGTYSNVDIPPCAALEQVEVDISQGAVTIDVMANDYDANGDSLDILSFDSTSKEGAAISRSSGTGPGGRDEIIYTPSSYTGLDSFYYKIEDSSGQTASGAVVISAWEPSLVYHWPLDGHLYDVVGGNHANGAVSYATGADGASNTAISVAGANYISSGTWLAPNLGGSGSRTVNFWFKAAEDMKAAVSYGGRGSEGALFEVLLDYPDDGFAGHFWGSTMDTLNSGSGTQPSVTWNTWNMVTLTYDGTNVKLYQNDTLKRTAALSLNTLPTNMYIGGHYDSYGEYAGYIDDVRVYSYDLDPTEVSALYNEMLSGGSSGSLIHHWPLDGDLLDAVGDNDGVATGTVSYVTGADGESKTAISVTASDYVSSIDNLSIAGPAQRTINFWFKAAQQTQAAVSCGSRGAFGELFEALLNFPTGGYAGHFWGIDMDTSASGTGTQPSVSWNNWTMVTMTYDGTTAKLYQDDVLKRTGTFALMTPPTPIYIGGHGVDGWYDDYAGLIDDVRVYNYAFDASEVATLYSQMQGTYTCDNPPITDLTDDCVVDIADLAVFAQDWLECRRIPESACP